MGPLHTPFEEWPADLQAEYSYNPQEAERLLDQAGLPRGADGVRLRVTYDHRDVIDLGWLEIVAGYWKEIGVEVEITVMDTGAWVDRRARGVYEMTTGDSGWDLSPSHIMSFYGYVHDYQGVGQSNQAGEYTGGVKDATMSRLYEAFYAATSKERGSRSSRSSTSTSCGSTSRSTATRRRRSSLPIPGSRGSTARRNCMARTSTWFCRESGSTRT